MAPGLVISGTAPRLVAFLLDLFIINVVLVILANVLGIQSSVQAPLGTGSTDFGALYVADGWAVVGVVANGLYFVASWTGGRRATLGQRVFGIQVGNAFDGASLTLEQAIRRWLGLGEFLPLFALVPATAGLAVGVQAIWQIILLVTTATNPMHQGLQDKFANTALVRPSNAGNGLVVACLVIAIIPVALVVLALVMLIAAGAEIESILSAVGESI
jgi:uncharacterized RDD family membrane protein YckC